MTNSVYLHIPFCSSLCTYCSFTKFFYNEKMVYSYLNSLLREIKTKYKGEIIKTIYIGGGTPSCLSVKELEYLFKIIKIFNFDANIEFTMEVNPESLTLEKLKLMQENKVNRISMGVESTILKNLKYLGRNHDFSLVKEKMQLIREVGITNINIDLIYALKDQTFEDLKMDILNILSLKPTHISTYSLEIYPQTILGIRNEKNISEDLDFQMYELICQELKKHGFRHYEISNFSKPRYQSRHNLVYWNNENYYGFGLSAASYIGNIRKTNTSSLKKYLAGNFLGEEEVLTKKDILSYALILGFRKIEGINKKMFLKKYGVNLFDLYNIKDLLKKGLLKENAFNIYIPCDKIYIENSILINFVGE